MFQILQLMTLWLGTVLLVLGGVYKIDRAGWNWFRLTGYDVNLAESHLDLIEQSASQCADRYDFITLEPTDPNRLSVASGVHLIDETVIIPKNIALTIHPGAQLRFGAGCSLVSYGPIHARGTQDAPILFTPKNRWLKWGVVGVVNAEKSLFENVLFEHARSAHVNGTFFPAGLTLIETDVEVSKSKFVNMFGKDAMNVQNSSALVRDNIFQNSYKDGLDLDGATGEVCFNEFINCDDEGIDLSENLSVRVFENKIFDSKGGRLSADNNLAEIVALNTLGYSER